MCQMTLFLLKNIMCSSPPVWCSPQRQREVEKQRDVAWDFKCMLRTRGEEEEEQKRAELQKEKRLQMGQYNEQLAREQRQQ